MLNWLQWSARVPQPISVVISERSHEKLPSSDDLPTIIVDKAKVGDVHVVTWKGKYFVHIDIAGGNTEQEMSGLLFGCKPLGRDHFGISISYSTLEVRRIILFRISI